MKYAIIYLCLFLCCTSLRVEAAEASPQSRPTEKGHFSLQLAIDGKELKNGPNSLDLSVRDRKGAPVSGARIKVTPWMPTMGHGVWEKPVVTERIGGVYRVENVTIIMDGLWALKVEVESGNLADGTAFTYYVKEKKKAAKAETAPREGLQRQSASYSVPDVTLLNQDGKKVNLRSLIESDKPVLINFIFTTCTTICPVMTATFSSLRSELGAAAAERVQLVSISIDPENDRPQRMKQYLSRFNWGPGWEFLTGSREEIGRVLQAFDAFVVDKMSHEPLFIARDPKGERWVRVRGLVRKSDLMRELERMENR